MPQRPIVPVAQIKKSVINQLNYILSSQSDRFDKIDFGRITFEIRKGEVYKVEVSNSLLVKGSDE